MTFIATFFSHFGAIRFRRMCEEEDLPARVMPVPRALSSSCGTCVRFEAELTGTMPGSGDAGAHPSVESLPVQPTEETEQIAQAAGGGYEIIWRAENA